MAVKKSTLNDVTDERRYFALKCRAYECQDKGFLSFVFLVLLIVSIIMLSSAVAEENTKIETKQVTCYDKMGNPIIGVMCEETKNTEAWEWYVCLIVIFSFLGLFLFGLMIYFWKKHNYYESVLDDNYSHFMKEHYNSLEIE